MPQLLLHSSLPVFKKRCLDLDFAKELEDSHNFKMTLATSLVMRNMVLGIEFMSSSLFQIISTMDASLMVREVGLKLLLASSLS